jgi:hypothetical protein
MSETHQGKLLKRYIKMNDVNVEADIIQKITFSKATFYKLYDRERIEPQYVNELLKLGIDFLGQSPVTRLKSGVQFTQKESGLQERVTTLEAQMAQMQSAMLDLYSRLPKQA